MVQMLRYGLLACLLLAGCAQPDNSRGPDAGMDATTSPSITNQPIPPSVAIIEGSLPEGAFWTECVGMYTTFIWPGTIGPSSSAFDWPPDDTQWASEVRMIIIECNRFGWGEFQRGPIRFVIEYENNHQFPEGCDGESPAQPWVLTSIWTDDAEVATQLRAVEGMPADVATISLARDELGTVLHGTATWGATDSKSVLESYQEPDPSTKADFGHPPRLYWRNGQGGASWIDFDVNVEGPTYPSERIATGTIQQPMLMAVLPHYTGQGYTFDAGTFGGPIGRFNDLECAQPFS